MKHWLSIKTVQGGLWQKIGNAFRKPRRAVEGSGQEIRGLDDIFPEFISDISLESHHAKPPTRPNPSESSPEASQPPAHWPKNTEPVAVLPVSGTLVMAACQRLQAIEPPAPMAESPAETAQTPSRKPGASTPQGLTAFDHIGQNNRIINNSINSLVSRYFEQCRPDADTGTAARGIPLAPPSC